MPSPLLYRSGTRRHRALLHRPNLPRMIRLYPNVIKHEENIQGLRRVHSEIQQENYNFRHQLADAAQRQRDIGVELREAEAVRAQRLQESKNVRQAAKGLSERVQGQQKASEDLQGLLARSQAGHERQLGTLARSELARHACWVAHGEAEATLQQVDAQAAAQEVTQRELEARLEAALASHKRLGHACRAAADEAVERRCELEKTGAQSSEHHEQASGHEAEEAQLQKHWGKISQAEVSLKEQLSTLDSALPESEQLRQAVMGSSYELELLKATLQRLDPELQRHRSAYEKARQQRQASQLFEKSEHASQKRIQQQLQELEERTGEADGAVREKEQEAEAERRRLQAREREAQRLENELRGIIAGIVSEEEEHEEEAAEIEEDVKLRREQLVAAEAEEAKLRALAEARKAVRDEEQAAHRAAQEEYNLHKDKCRCVIC